MPEKQKHNDLIILIFHTFYCMLPFVYDDDRQINVVNIVSDVSFFLF